MSNKRILALDLAGRFGYAIGSDGNVEASGSVQIPPAPPWQHFVLGPRFVWLLRWIEAFVVEHRPDEMYFEKPIMRPNQDNTHIIRVLHGFVVIAETAAAIAGIEASEVDARTVRKYLLGKVPHGREEQKAAVMKMCRLRGWRAVDDNAGDALALLDYAHAVERMAAHKKKIISILPEDRESVVS